MALPTYLGLVNEVLVRMREPQVSSIAENTLSALVAVWINDAKRTVEDSYNWNALCTTLTAVTAPGAFNYALDGSGARFKVIDVYNYTTHTPLLSMASTDMTQRFLSNTLPPSGAPTNYSFNGINANGDTQVDLFPSPDRVYTVFFNLFVPQDKLVNNTDVMLVPSDPVVLLAFARALVERGEDQGMNSSEAYGMYKTVLADFIAIETSRYPEEQTWVGV